MARKSKETLCIEEFQEDALSRFSEALSCVKDPRRKQGQRYPFDTVLLTMLLAIIAGANTASGFELWAQAHEAELSAYLPMPHGVPTQDVFLNILASVDVDEFAELYDRWISVCLSVNGGNAENTHLAVDGKTSRRSYDLRGSKLSAHTLGVMAVRNGILISQLDCSRKTNEITVIPTILEKLNLRGATVTIDAIAAQTKIVETISDKGGDYIIGIKANQPKLYEDAEKIAEERKKLIDDAEFKSDLEYSTDTDKGHGRIEQRETYVFRNLKNAVRDCEKWRGLMAIIMVVRTVTKLNPKENQPETTTERQFYITNKDSTSAAEIGRFIRDHWKIENSCHWILDVVFREDDARNRAGNSAKNFAALRRMALAILKADNLKTSVNLRRMKAAWDFKYLIGLLGLKAK